MTAPASRFACEAEQLVGTPFRLQGRDPRTGLDCIGLAACALERSGISAVSPEGYSLRNLSITDWLACAYRSGFEPVTGERQRGDLLLVCPGPAQHHLLIALGAECFIHAHAGLRQVVVQRGLSGWPVIKHWRLAT